jgi:hypothetical protein
MRGFFVNSSNMEAPSSEQNPQVFHKSGEFAPVSGIYLVKHAGDGPIGAEILIIRGGSLPRCSDCQMPLLFSLVREAPYIGDDVDFSGEGSSVVD